MLSSVIQTRRAKNIFVSVFCIILAVIPADAALYYGAVSGPYGNYVGGVAYVRPGRRGYRYYGRRLLGQEEKVAQCQTMLDVIESRPMLSDLAKAIRDLPRIREALNNATSTDTFFAPSNDAIKSLVQWGGYDDIKSGLKEFFTTKEIKGLIIAYHAIPNQKLLYGQLNAMNGKFLQTALERVLDAPGALEVSSWKGNIFLKGYGSEAKIVAADIPACGSVVHIIDGVLLPVDGDGVLTDEQKSRIKRAKDAIEKIKDDEGLAPAPAPEADFAPAPAPEPAIAPAPAPEDKIIDDIDKAIDEDMYSDGSYAAAPTPAPAPSA